MVLVVIVEVVVEGRSSNRGRVCWRMARPWWAIGDGVNSDEMEDDVCTDSSVM